MNNIKNMGFFYYMIFVVGLGMVNFYCIYYLVIMCLVCSLILVIVIFVVFFWFKKVCLFYNFWIKCECFVVYMVFCDGFYSVVYLMDYI